MIGVSWTMVGRFGRLALILAAVAVMTSFAVAGGHRLAAASNDPSCRTSFLLYTDPHNFGEVTTKGSIVTVKNSGILGQYTSGRFAGFTISGLQALTFNQATGKAAIQGSFVATSPDQQSSFVLRYQGKADLVAAVATGRFRATDGTGSLKDFRATGQIEADYLGNFTFSGVDIGLC